MMSSTMFLAIDCGNTRVKVTLLEGMAADISSAKTYFCEAGDSDALLQLVDMLKPQHCAMASVAGIDTRLVESLRNAMAGNFLLMTPATPLPICVDYADFSTLGVDRKIGACGAAALFPGEGCLIADAGTALTLDLVDSTGTFIGGNISPGVQMRLDALHRKTSLLPALEGRTETTIPEFGNSTPSAIFAGAAGGLLDEVAMAAMRAQRLDTRRLILTGGDASALQRWLPSRLADAHVDMEVAVVNNLLAIGLKSVYDFVTSIND